MSEKTADDRIEEVNSQLTSEYLSEARELFSNRLHDYGTTGETPIEILMAMGLYYSIVSEMWHGGEGKVNDFEMLPLACNFDQYRHLAPEICGVHICPQMQIGKYRADFVARYASRRGGVAYGAIECDGHNYHDLTKEQASHDRERDRFFQQSGLLILRYTGSEIWRSPLKCAADALSILEKRSESADALRWKV
jgi:very-short-patch-repair endonuclease